VSAHGCVEFGLLDAYTAHLEARGGAAVAEIAADTAAAGAWLARFGGPADFAASDLAAQLAVPKRACRFVDWLIVTGRLVAPAEYLIARRPKLGLLFRRAEPAWHDRFCAAAAGLGFKASTVAIEWVALSQLCAVTGAAGPKLTYQQLVAGREALVEAAKAHWAPGAEHQLRSAMFSLEATLFHLGVIDQMTTTGRHNPRAATRADKWAGVAATLTATFGHYLDQTALSRRASTMQRQEIYLRELARFLGTLDPPVTQVADLRRTHIEAYRNALADRPGKALHHHSVRDRLGILRNVFERLIEWEHPDAPPRVPIFAGDLSIKDRPLPRFLDDPTFTKLMVATRAHPDAFVRLVVEFLARTGLRKSELMALRLDAVVEIGSAYWLRVPVGKLHNDRYIPLHPQLKTMLDDWVAEHRSADVRSELVFVDRGRPIPAGRIDRALDAVAQAAGIGNTTPHQLRHTLATQAINRGMSLEAVAALLGHKDLSMTLVYARIADRTVADEYFSVSQKVEALYDKPRQLPADAEGTKMAALRKQMHQRMLGNGLCLRPVELDCHFESICENCTYFETNVEFRTTLQRQRDHAATRGQAGRKQLFDDLLTGIDTAAS